LTRSRAAATARIWASLIAPLWTSCFGSIEPAFACCWTASAWACVIVPLATSRCLVALGQPAAEAPLAEARELFASMGYDPALAETEALVGETTAAAS
jgi:hypothetical protein